MNIYLVSVIISIYYAFMKIIEYKIRKKESLDGKSIFVNSTIVFISSIIGCLTLTHFSDIFGLSKKIIPVFVKEPDF